MLHGNKLYFERVLFLQTWERSATAPSGRDEEQSAEDAPPISTAALETRESNSLLSVLTLQRVLHHPT